MSVLLPTRPLNAVAATAVALLVVGAGGAIGVETSASSPSHRAGSSLQTRTSTGGNSGSNAQPGATPSSTTTTSPAQTSTSIGSVPVAGPGSSSTTLAARTTTTIASSSTTQPTTPVNPADEPATGTYSYATQGSSTVVNNTYKLPPTTTIDVARSGCGETEKWNEAPGDSTTIAGCPVTGGIHVVSETTQTTVSGQTMTQSFTCDSDSFVPLQGTPGQKWKWACHTSNGETSTQTVVLDGPVTLTVGGRSVTTEHVSITSVLSGSITGTSDTEEWFDRIGLRIKETGNINATAYGRFPFKSQYTIQLNSLEPS